MGTMTKDLAEERARKAGEVCNRFVKSTVSWSPWPGRARAVGNGLRDEWARSLGAEAKSVRGGTELYDWAHPALAACTALKREAAAWWQQAAPVAWPWQDGCRLLPKGAVDDFEGKMQEFKRRLAYRADVVQSYRGALLADAGQRRGRAFDPADYPADLSLCFGLTWGLDVLAVPEELREVSSSAYAAEQARQAMRVVGAVQMAEEGFARELLCMITDLGERLREPPPGGKRAPVLESTVRNLAGFLGRFSAVAAWGADDLEEVVGEARGVLSGLGVDDLRHDAGVRADVSGRFGDLARHLAGLLPAPAGESSPENQAAGVDTGYPVGV
jgi:hypothetical protein